MHLAITDTTNNIGGMVARHLSTRGLPLILPLPPPRRMGQSCEFSSITVWAISR